MDAKNINVLHFPTSSLNLCWLILAVAKSNDAATYLTNDPPERATSVRSREDIFVHEQAPDQVFELPDATDTSDLEKEDTIVVEQVVDLTKEGSITTNTNVLERNIRLRT